MAAEGAAEPGGSLWVIVLSEVQFSWGPLKVTDYSEWWASISHAPSACGFTLLNTWLPCSLGVTSSSWQIGKDWECHCVVVRGRGECTHFSSHFSSQSVICDSVAEPHLMARDTGRHSFTVCAEVVSLVLTQLVCTDRRGREFTFKTPLFSLCPGTQLS